MSGRKQPVFDLGTANVWLCDRCGAHGPANFGPEETAFAAIEQVRAAHAKQSPACKGGNDYRIQVYSIEGLKAKGRVA